MTEQAEDRTAVSIDSVIRSYTSVELALRDITASIAHFRSASEQLDTARSDQIAVRDAMTAVSAALGVVGASIDAARVQLAVVSEVVGRIDPERLWTELAIVRDEARANEEAASQARIDPERLWTELAIVRDEARNEANRAALAQNITATNVRRTLYVAAGSLAAGIVTLGLVVLRAVGIVG